MRKLLMTAAIAALLPATANAAAFINGSFEDGTAPGGFITVGNGASDITGWTVTGNSVDYIGSYWMAGDGSRSVDLNGNGQGGVSQTFDTTAGKTYTVTFLLAGNDDGLPTTKSVEVLATGGSAETFTFDTTGTSNAAMGWTEFTYTFTASDDETTLSFSSLDAGFYGAALDGVSISAVPEASTWAMMIGGFGLVGGALRRRNTKVAFA